MAERDLLVVLGATGNQGGAILRYFANVRPGAYRLRGVTRNPRSQAAQDLQHLGIEMCKADRDDTTSLHAALFGATHIFATTDSNQVIFNAIQHPETLPEGETPRSFAYAKELRQGNNIADAAKGIETLRTLIWSSLPSPRKWSHGEYQQVSMWDAKEDIADRLASHPVVGPKLRVLVPGFFASNALAVPHLYGPQKVGRFVSKIWTPGANSYEQPDGVYELALPMDGNIRVPIADLDADMGKWVAALIQADPSTLLVGATEMLSWTEWLDIWGQVNGVTVRFRRALDEEYARKVEGISEAVLEEFHFVEKYDFMGGNDKALYPDDASSSSSRACHRPFADLQQLRARGINIEPTKIEDHIRASDWSAIL